MLRKGQIKRGKVRTWAENRWCRLGEVPRHCLEIRRARILRDVNKLPASPENSPSHEKPRLYGEGFICKTGFFFLSSKWRCGNRWVSICAHRKKKVPLWEVWRSLWMKYLGIYFGEFNNANHQLESIGKKGIFAFLFTRLSFVREDYTMMFVCLFLQINTSQ